MTNKDVSRYPFFQGDYSAGQLGRLHFMWGNLSRVDCRLNNPEGKPRCNWFDPEKQFLGRADKLPLYGASYMHLFMKVAKGWGELGKVLRSIKSARDVDDMLRRSISMYVECLS